MILLANFYVNFLFPYSFKFYFSHIYIFQAFITILAGWQGGGDWGTANLKDPDLRGRKRAWLNIIIKAVFLGLHQLLGGICPSEILSQMRPKFSREGWVAGFFGQCPKFDRIFFFMASLTNTLSYTQCFKGYSECS
jgi:hypothetical protein